MKSFLIVFGALAFACICIGSAFGEGSIVRDLPPGLQVPDAAKPQPGFDVERATEAWLALLSPEQRQLSDAYFEGGYWLILWDFLYGAAISLALLALGWSARLRDLAERMTRFRALQAVLYWTEYALLTTLLSFPLGVYEGFFREHLYGLSNQTFGAWLGDQGKGLAVGLVLGSLLAMPLFAVVRRLTGASAFLKGVQRALEVWQASAAADGDVEDTGDGGPPADPSPA